MSLGMRVSQTRLSLHQSLSHCELITDDGILHLSNSTCGHERLRVLELDNCLLITDVALEHLENCRGLERLELYDCQQVTRAGIKRMRVSVAGAGTPGTISKQQIHQEPTFSLGCVNKWGQINVSLQIIKTTYILRSVLNPVTQTDLLHKCLLRLLQNSSNETHPGRFSSQNGFHVAWWPAPLQGKGLQVVPSRSNAAFFPHLAHLLFF